MRFRSPLLLFAVALSLLGLGSACGGGGGGVSNGGTGGGGGHASGGRGGGSSGGGSSGSDYTALCKQACNKGKACSTSAALDCDGLCSTCKDPAKAADKANQCLALTDCTQLAICSLQMLTFCSDSTGAGGAAGTGGLSGGTGGAAGSSGAGGAGSGSADCTTSCTKAYKCCMAAVGTSLCNQVDPATSCANPSTAASNASSCTSGLATYGKLSSAAACH